MRFEKKQKFLCLTQGINKSQALIYSKSACDLILCLQLLLAIPYKFFVQTLCYCLRWLSPRCKNHNSENDCRHNSENDYIAPLFLFSFLRNTLFHIILSRRPYFLLTTEDIVLFYISPLVEQIIFSTLLYKTNRHILNIFPFSFGPCVKYEIWNACEPSFWDCLAEFVISILSRNYRSSFISNSSVG